MHLEAELRVVTLGIGDAIIPRLLVGRLTRLIGKWQAWCSSGTNFVVDSTEGNEYEIEDAPEEFIAEQEWFNRLDREAGQQIESAAFRHEAALIEDKCREQIADCNEAFQRRARIREDAYEKYISEVGAWE